MKTIKLLFVLTFFAQGYAQVYLPQTDTLGYIFHWDRSDYLQIRTNSTPDVLYFAFGDLHDSFDLNWPSKNLWVTVPSINIIRLHDTARTVDFNINTEHYAWWSYFNDDRTIEMRIRRRPGCCWEFIDNGVVIFTWGTGDTGQERQIPEHKIRHILNRIDAL